MMFCPKCGSILRPKSDGNKRIMVCSCGFVNKDLTDARISETVEKKETIEVVEKEVEPHPIVDAKCPKCGHKKAYMWTVQTRASDEPETKFLKCEKCEKVWRDYS